MAPPSTQACRRAQPYKGPGELDLVALLERVTGPMGRPQAVGVAEAGSAGTASSWGRGLAELARYEAGALVVELGLERRAAERLAAAFELGRRVEQALLPARPSLTSAERVQALLAPFLRGLERETFVLLLLDGKHRLRRREVVSVGTLTSSLVHPREVYRCAVRESAAAIVCAHNHPSGDPEPSPEDLEVTRRLVECGRLLGIPLLDHVILGGGRHVSLRERLGFRA